MIIVLSPQQEEGYRRFRAWFVDRPWERGERVYYYQGGLAGTGKTTAVQVWVQRLMDEGLLLRKPLYCAYTGKAALVLRQKGCEGARTIHSLMMTPTGDGSGDHAEELAGLVAEREAKLSELRVDVGQRAAPGAGVFRTMLAEGQSPLRARVDEIDKRIEEIKALVRAKGPSFRRNDGSDILLAGLVIVDECSMVDGHTGEDMCWFGVPILAMGDPAQLPPVRSEGGGFFTRNEPDYLLTEIHRQAEGSGILQLATRVRNGSRIDERDAAHDVDVIQKSDRAAAQAAALAADQIIVGRNATRHAINRRVRELRGITDPMPIAGDKLVCLRNNHEAGLLNGSLWECVSRAGDGQQDGKRSDLLVMTLRSLDEPDRADVEVVAHPEHFVGRGDEISYWNRLSAQEFAYGYALTCHKAQGSQWDRVVVFDESRQFGKDEFRHAYTAVTRAARHLTVVI